MGESDGVVRSEESFQCPDYTKGTKDLKPKHIYYSQKSSMFPCTVRFSLSDGVTLHNHPDKKLPNAQKQLRDFKSMAIKQNWSSKKGMPKERPKKNSIFIDVNKI